MEYLLLAGVTLLIGCCVVALVLEPPAHIVERSSTAIKTGPGARPSGQSRRSRRGRMATGTAVQSPVPPRPGPDRAPAARSAQRETRAADSRGRSARDDAPPYSPQELRNLLDRRSPATPNAS
jgi:hypothetical protein